MNLAASLLDIKFILLICGLAVLRCVWPRKHSAALFAIGSALVIGLASWRSLLAIGGATLFYLYPLHRLMRRLRVAEASQATDAPATTQGLSKSAVVGIGSGATSVLVAAEPVAKTEVATQPNNHGKSASRICMTLAIIGLVAFLVVFKLNREFTLPWLGGPWLHAELLALVGFSYFIFRAISFLNITSILRLDERQPWTVLAYTLFPPTITSGPIQKYQDFRQQLSSPEPLSRALLWESTYRITRGYFRKTIVAFILLDVVNKILARDSLTAVYSVAAVALLYLFVYFDFAGYSDIAIGFGLLMGIRVPENFRKPFVATTVSEFWRNWHITLVDWLRDHVFIPLGGMKATRMRAAALAFLIMLVCGLWHGLVWAFVVWGAWHGIALFLEAVAGAKPIPPSRRHGFRFWSRVALTNAIVALGGIWFLPDTHTIMKVLTGFVRW